MMVGTGPSKLAHGELPRQARSKFPLAIAEETN